MTYVEPDEFERIVERLEARRKAVAAAKRKRAKAKTLAEKVAACRELTAARTLPLTEQEQDL